MSLTIPELIAKQAEAVKNNADALLLADSLEAQAKLIRANSKKPITITFAAMQANRYKQKADRLAAFGAAMKKSKEDTAHQLLTDAGWLRGFHNTETCESNYGIKTRPGYLLKIKGDFFSVRNGVDIKQAATPIGDLNAYLEFVSNVDKLYNK